MSFICFTGNCNCTSDNSELSTITVAFITFAVTFIVSVTVTTIITFIVAYVCVKNIHDHKHQSSGPQQEIIYEEVCPPSSTVITKNDLELRPNPAYGTSHKVIMDTNPAYEICK